MNAILEKYTELFDLFGETGTCTICQEDLKDGERIRTIKQCNHLFHAPCLDSWLVRKQDCPMCRTPLIPPDPVVEDRPDISHLENITNRVQTLYTTLQDIAQGTIGTHVNFQNVFTNVRQLLENSNIAMVHVSTVELTMRYALTFSIVDGILRHYPAAADYMPNRTGIAGMLSSLQVNGLRPFPIETYTRSTLTRSYEKLRDELKTRLQVTGDVRRIRAQPMVKNWIPLLTESQELRPYWTAP